MQIKRYHMTIQILLTVLITIVCSFGLPADGVYALGSAADKQVSNKIARQHFGIDGTTQKFINNFSEMTDVWAGVNGLRWKQLEPIPPKAGKHFYQWGISDRFIQNFQPTGRKLQINIRIFNDWVIEYSRERLVDDPYSGKKVGAFKRIRKNRLADWAAFISAFVERYDHDGYLDMPGLAYPVTHIQIESEADNVWVNADGYIEALSTAYRAAKKASPAVQIMAAGFNVFDFFSLNKAEQDKMLQRPLLQHKVNFLKKFFSESETFFDILSLHLNRDYESIPDTVKWFQNQMAINGYQKPVWSEDTSSGPFFSSLSDHTYGRSTLKLLEKNDAQTVNWFRQEQAKLLVKKAVTAFASGVEKIFISNESDWPDYYMVEWRHMGLLDAQGNRKPAFLSFKTMVTQLDDFITVDKLNLSSRISGYIFTRPSGKVYVLWSEETQVVNLPSKGTSFLITDLYGSTHKTSFPGITIGASPVYITEE